MKKLDNILNRCYGFVMSATPLSRKGEKSDTGSFGKNSLGALYGLEDDFKELGRGRVFAGGHVGEKISLGIRAVLVGGKVGALHDGETGKSRISLREDRRVGEKGLKFSRESLHTKGTATGKNYIARGILNSSDERVGFMGFYEGAGGG